MGNEKGKDLNESIHKLVEKGLPVRIQQALDTLRVTGNHAIHPLGLIDFEDDRYTATSLFDLMNIIVDVMIRQPRKVEDFYNALPTKDLDNIKKRDGK